MNIEKIKSSFLNHKRKAIEEPFPEGTKRASVLVPLFCFNHEIHLLLTVRTDDVETHKGQIAFPGGMNDPVDINSIDTALREAEEEIGLPRSTVEILGTLDDLLTPTQFLITPIAGVLENTPSLSLNPAEVAEIFYVPLSFFLDSANGYMEERIRNGKTYNVWFFRYQQYTIWGATAGIIKNLVNVIQ